MAFIWKSLKCIVIHKTFILYPIHFKSKYFTDVFGHFLLIAVFPYVCLQLRLAHSIFQMILASFRGSHLCCLVTCCWGTITTYRAEFAQSQIKSGRGARDNYHLWVQNWMQWFWHLMSLTLGFPSTYRVNYTDIWRAAQGTDLDQSHYAPWLVCPVEQFCDINKRMHRDSKGRKKTLRSVLLSKALYWQTRVAFCAPHSGCWYTKEKTKWDLMCWRQGMWACNVSSENKGSKMCPGSEQFRSLNTCWYHPVSVPLICCPAWPFLELQIKSLSIHTLQMVTLGCRFGLTDCINHVSAGYHFE